MQVGSDDDGYAVRLKLKHFLEYCQHPQHAPADDSPLYIFAHLERRREEGKALLQHYTGVCGCWAGAQAGVLSLLACGLWAACGGREVWRCMLGRGVQPGACFSLPLFPLERIGNLALLMRQGMLSSPLART